MGFSTKGTLEISWLLSLVDWVLKVNTYGVSRNNSSTVGCDGLIKDIVTVDCSGLIKDQNGCWLYDFVKPLDNCSTFQIECWGVVCDLQTV